MKSTPGKPVKRITLKWGRKKRRLVLVAPPWPQYGEMIHIDGEPWMVTKVEDETLLQLIPTNNGGRP